MTKGAGQRASLVRQALELEDFGTTRTDCQAWDPHWRHGAPRVAGLRPESPGKRRKNGSKAGGHGALGSPNCDSHPLFVPKRKHRKSDADASVLKGSLHAAATSLCRCVWPRSHADV